LRAFNYFIYQVYYGEKMKKILYLLPLLFMIIACGAQPAPTQDVGNMVRATLTAIAQNNLQVVAPQPTFTPVSIQTQQLATQVAPPSQPSAIQVAPILPGPSLSARDFIPALGTVIVNLSFPSSFIPAMRVAFFNLTDGSVSYIDTSMNPDPVSMNLPAGSYQVVAYPYSGGAHAAGSPMMGDAGGYTQMVPCGLSADCTDHSLIPITVVTGQTITVNPGDWYAPEGTFPPMPTDK
jgi:hypothetical protein